MLRLFDYHAFANFIIDFMQRCLSTPERNDRSWVATHHDGVQTLRLTLYLPSPTPLLRAWARLKLTSVSWEDALAVAGDVDIHVLQRPSFA